MPIADDEGHAPEHGIEDAYYNLGEPHLECECGFIARGFTWQEAGGALDEHFGRVPGAPRTAKEGKR